MSVEGPGSHLEVQGERFDVPQTDPFEPEVTRGIEEMARRALRAL